jgi:hypothetical protein
MRRLDLMENFYLNILRVSILVLATLFLLGAVIGLVNAVPKLVPQSRSADARTLVSGASLKDYRAENRAATPSDSNPLATSTPAEPQKIDSRIATASRSFVAWGTKTGHDLSLANVEQVLNSKQQSLADKLQGDYADSLVNFSREVLASARSDDDINALIDWHLAKFSAAEAAEADAEQARAVKTAAARQDALMLAEASGVAFVAFLLLLFVFVLVKIERNLRLVMVQSADGSNRITSAPA